MNVSTRMPHAMILAGNARQKKHEAATLLAHRLLCQQPTSKGSACGVCKACQLVQAQSHPDLMKVVPEEEGQIIGVDAIRDVVTFVNETPQQGGYRVIWIEPAHALNINAANALLKTLEEPSEHVLFLLLTDQHLRLPATIRSRCQMSSYHDVNQSVELDDTAKSLLNGIFLLGQKKMDPLQLAAQCQEHQPIRLFEVLLSLLRDMLRIATTREAHTVLLKEYVQQSTEMANRLSVMHLCQLIETIQTTYGKLSRSMNLNKQLLLEDIFIEWDRYVSG